ncbi:MAG: arginine deiminase [Myxococcota bacterium]|jgi:arginine deiminase
MSVRVYDEVSPLRRVLVHRPGGEVARMTQDELHELLFDDILSADVAGSEHDLLSQILASEGAEVLELCDVLRDAVARAPADAREALVACVASSEGRPDLTGPLGELSDAQLAAALIEGLRWSDLPGAPLTAARLHARHDPNDRPLAPLPNLMFTRDPCISVYDQVVLGRMATQARAREPQVVQFALTYGLDVPVRFLFDQEVGGHPRLNGLEGGDLLVVDRRFLLIGCSERTTAATVERLARDVLFPAFPELESVYPVLMPAKRSVMHLDTVLTQIDRDLFLGHAPMIVHGEGIEVLQLRRGTPPKVLTDATVLDVLRAELGDAVTVVPCGGHDPVHQQREQWTDGANAVCLGPGRIVLYARNARTIALLEREHGFTRVALSEELDPEVRQARLVLAREHARVVYTFTGSELSRARGGARCMTMPLRRG